MAPRRTRSLTAFALIAIATIAPVTLGQSDPTGPAWVQGPGMWGQGDHTEPANATWLLVEQEAAAYHIVTASGIQATCTQGNGTLTTPDGTGATGRCSGEGSHQHILLEFNADAPLGSPGEPSTKNATTWAGTFAARGASPLTASDEAGTFTLLLLTGATAGSLAGAVVLLLLFLRERRLTGHLARRLWQRSRGKSASKRPESLEQENVRRILVRSKN